MGDHAGILDAAVLFCLFVESWSFFFCLARRALTRGGCACSRRERTGRQKSWAVLCERCTHGRHTTLDVNVTDEPMQGKMGHFLPDAMLEVVLADSTREREQLVQRLLVACSGATTLAGRLLAESKGVEGPSASSNTRLHPKCPAALEKLGRVWSGCICAQGGCNGRVEVVDMTYSMKSVKTESSARNQTESGQGEEVLRDRSSLGNPKDLCLFCLTLEAGCASNRARQGNRETQGLGGAKRCLALLVRFATKA